MGTTAVLGGIAVGSQLLARREERKANKAQRNAQKAANEVEKRRSEIANQRSRKQASAQAASMRASNIAAAHSYGGGGIGSSLLGANQAIASNLSSAIGFQNTMLAANTLQNNLLQRGADRAARHQARAGNYAAIGGLSGQAMPFFMPTGGTS